MKLMEGVSKYFVQKKNNSNKKANLKKIEKILKDESKIDSKAYERFNTSGQCKKSVKEFLVNIKGKEIIGYGASTKGKYSFKSL